MKGKKKHADNSYIVSIILIREKAKGVQMKSALSSVHFCPSREHAIGRRVDEVLNDAKFDGYYISLVSCIRSPGLGTSGRVTK